MTYCVTESERQGESAYDRTKHLAHCRTNGCRAFSRIRIRNIHKVLVAFVAASFLGIAIMPSAFAHPPPAFVWIRQFGTSTQDMARSVAVDSTGVYVTGDTFGTLPNQTSAGDPDAFIRKYDANGNEVWTRQFGTSAPDYAYSVAVGSTGVYVAGETYGVFSGQTRTGVPDAFIRKYDVDGNEVWTRQFGTPGQVSAYSVTVGSTGIYVAGVTDGILPGQTSAGGLDAFIRKYSSSGTEQWTRQFGTSSDDWASGVAVDASNVYVAGHTSGTLPGQTSAGSLDAFVRKYDVDGNEVWTRQFGTPEYDYAWAVSVGSTGVYVAGDTYGTFPGQTSAGSSDALVRKYDVDGNEVWTRQFGSPVEDIAWSVAVGSTGVYVAGGTGGTLPGQTSAGKIDAFIRKYDANGNEVWTRQFGTSEFDFVVSVAVGSTGVYVAGSTEGALPGQTSAGGYDAFVARHSDNSSPNVPPKPSGQQLGCVNTTYQYSTYASDPDNDKVTIKFDWRDGSTTDVGPVNSGTTVYATHSWSARGTYDVRAMATDEHGATSDWSPILQVVICAPPGPPTGLTTTPGNGQVTLTWSAPSDDGGSTITIYKIFRGTTSGGEGWIKDFTSFPPLSYTDTGLTNGQTYYYYVKAKNNPCPEGLASNEASATPGTIPGPPENLVTTPADHQVTLTWDPPLDDGGSPITNYRIYRGPSPGNETFLIEIGNVLTYLDTLLVNGQLYCYQVSAKNSWGEGARSNEACATPGTIPGSPQNLVATPEKGRQVRLTWSEPLDNGGYAITIYKIYRRVPPNSEEWLYDLTTFPPLEYVDTGLTNGQEYCYRVSAVNFWGEGDKSNEDCATPRPVILLDEIDSGIEWERSGDMIVHGVFNADVDNDTKIEIITVGETFDPGIPGDKGAEIRIWQWDGNSLTLEKSELVQPGIRASLNSVYAEDVNLDGITEIFAVGWEEPVGAGYHPLFCRFTWNGITLDTACTLPIANPGVFYSVTAANVNWDVGKYASIAVDSGGLAHISYYSYSKGDLKYAKWTGSAWSIETVDESGDVGQYTSIALDNSGNPHISYYDATNHNLKYARKSGASWYVETVDSVGDVGQFTSIRLDSTGKPHITYYDLTNGDLKHAVKDTGWTKTTVDGATANVGQYTSLAIDGSDNLHVSYYNVSGGNLKYIKKTGSIWGTPETPDSTGDVGQYTSIAVSGNYVHVSYYDVTGGNLKYVMKTDSNWGTPEAIDSTGDVGGYASIAVDTGSNVHVGYYDATNLNPKYVKKNGGGWGTPETVDSDADAEREVVVAGQMTIGGVSQGYLRLMTWVTSGNTFDETTWSPGNDVAAYSVYAADVNGDGVDEILTVGYTRPVNDPIRRGQLRMWSYTHGFSYGEALWGGFPTYSAEAFSVYAANVDPYPEVEIMTCGYSNDGAQDRGHLRVYHAVPGLTFLKDEFWVDEGNRCNSVYAADVDSDSGLEIVTGGWATISGKSYAEIRLWRFVGPPPPTPPTITQLATKQWRDFMWGLIDPMQAKVNSLIAMDVDMDSTIEIVSAGQVTDGFKWWGQLRIWYDP